MQFTWYVYVCYVLYVSNSEYNLSFIRGSRSLEDKLALYLYLTTISSSTYASKYITYPLS